MNMRHDGLMTSDAEEALEEAMISPASFLIKYRFIEKHQVLRSKLTDIIEIRAS
jgi:hypothetical protein